MGNQVTKRNFFQKVVTILTDTEKLNKSILLKESTEVPATIDELKNQLNTVPGEDSKKLQLQIKLLEYGAIGEKRVLFELLNSFVPMYILHDLRIEHEELKAQYDFVIITRKYRLVIEVKNYYGNILVNKNDEFIRRIMKGNRIVHKEGFYSPIRQVQRQVDILETKLKSIGLIEDTPVRHVVVFVNNKTILDKSAASKGVAEKIIRTDGLVNFIKNELAKESPVHLKDQHLLDISNGIKSIHQETQAVQIEGADETLLLQSISDNNEDVTLKDDHIKTSLSEDELKEKLIEYRRKTAEKLDVKAFLIFTNKMMDELITVKPTTLKELMGVKGFGLRKVNDFGEAIIAIFKN
ncbi:NERD domain-containing protein [Ureibacillus composti]|nr:NERD domain-containing protein [Ureibacillus composti]